MNRIKLASILISISLMVFPITTHALVMPDLTNDINPSGGVEADEAARDGEGLNFTIDALPGGPGLGVQEKQDAPKGEKGGEAPKEEAKEAGEREAPKEDQAPMAELTPLEQMAAQIVILHNPTLEVGKDFTVETNDDGMVEVAFEPGTKVNVGVKTWSTRNGRVDRVGGAEAQTITTGENFVLVGDRSSIQWGVFNGAKMSNDTLRNNDSQWSNLSPGARNFAQSAPNAQAHVVTVARPRNVGGVLDLTPRLQVQGSRRVAHPGTTVRARSGGAFVLTPAGARAEPAVFREPAAQVQDALVEPKALPPQPGGNRQPAVPNLDGVLFPGGVNLGPVIPGNLSQPGSLIPGLTDPGNTGNILGGGDTGMNIGGGNPNIGEGMIPNLPPVGGIDGINLPANQNIVIPHIPEPIQ